jgi:hypothetical protein
MSRDTYVLTRAQAQALEYARRKAELFHRQTSFNVKSRFAGLGYDEEIMKKVIEHIKNVKVIIHVDLNGIMPFMFSDTLYRNQFEVNKINNNWIRVDWENNLFHKLYGDWNVNVSEKVKYGCLNMYNQQFGCASAHLYGESYFVLKDSLKERITFVNGDSSFKQIHICTFPYFQHLLLYVDNRMIHNLASIVTGKNYLKNTYPYIEAQIHGDVDFRP